MKSLATIQNCSNTCTLNKYAGYRLKNQINYKEERNLTA